MSHSQRNILLLQIFSALQGTIFMLPVFIPYYRDEIGLNFRDFLAGEAVFAAVVIAMEVPTGWLADVWKRKYALALGMAFYILGFGVLLIADSFFDAAAAQGIIGIGVSLISGSINALLYDTLAEDGRAGDFRRLEGRRHGTTFYAVGLSCLAGGFLYEIDHKLPLILSLGAFILALLAALLLHEPRREKRAAEHHPLADMLATMRYALHGHREIAGIILFCMILFSATKLLLWSQQPYFELLAIPEAWFGLFTAAGFLLGGLAGHLGHLAEGRATNRIIFRWMLAAACTAFAVAGLMPGYHGIALLLTGSLLWGFGWPRVQDAINRRVTSERRATILSTSSLTINLAFIPLSLIFGAAADSYGIATALAGTALWLAVAGGGALFLIRNRHT